MPLDHRVVLESQHFADQLFVLVAVHDDNSVDSLVDALDEEPKIGDALQRMCPVAPQCGLAVNNTCRFRQELGGHW
jgi:hypothetical protein